MSQMYRNALSVITGRYRNDFDYSNWRDEWEAEREAELAAELEKDTLPAIPAVVQANLNGGLVIESSTAVAEDGGRIERESE